MSAEIIPFPPERVVRKLDFRQAVNADVLLDGLLALWQMIDPLEEPEPGGGPDIG